MQVKHVFGFVEPVPVSRQFQNVRSISRSGLVKYELLDARLKVLKMTAKNAGSSIMLGLKQPETTDPYATVVKLTF